MTFAFNEEEIDINDYIQANITKKNIENFDYYNRNINFDWKNNQKLKKIYNISFGKRSHLIFNSISNILLIDKFAYLVNSQTEFIKVDLEEQKIISKFKLEEKFDPNLVLPTSIIKTNDYFFISLGNGKIFKINEEGKIILEKEFLKT